MGASEAARGDAAGRPPAWRPVAAAIAICGGIFVYYWLLLADFRPFSVKPIRYDLVFNSMIEYMARGRFDVDPDVILQEAFTRDGRAYAYFGVMPALLRLPILLWPRFREVDFTVVFCAAAATIAAVAQLAAVRVAARSIGDPVGRRRVLLFASAVVIFGGPQVQFLRPSVYQESAMWSAAIASIFVLLAFRWCIELSARKPALLVAMAALAGVCLLTRVSTSVGLYAACGAIMLRQLIVAARGASQNGTVRSLLIASRIVLLPSLILIGCAAICGTINYARWGSPLTFQDYRYYNLLAVNDPAYDVLINYGYFNIRRIPFGLSYMFLPIWTIIGPDGHFLFRALQDRLYYTVELPPATFLLSDPLLIFLSVIGCFDLTRSGSPGTDRPAARMVAASLAIPGLLILMAIAVTFRYRMEFYPLLEFLALFGMISLPAEIVARPRWLTGICVLLVATSIGFSHVFLLAYKIAPWGDSAVVEPIGWAAAGEHYFHLKYTGFDRLFRSK